MKRLLSIGAALAFAASAAEAAPSFGGARISSSAGQGKTTEVERGVLAAWIERVVIETLKGDATAPVAKSKRKQPAQGELECEAEKKAEEDKQAQVEPGLQAGPEPIYLAF